MRSKVSKLSAAAIVAAIVFMMTTALAATVPVKAEATAGKCGVPTVIEVEHFKKNVALVTIEVLGNPKHFKVSCNGKKVRAYDFGRQHWMAYFKVNKTYTIKAKTKGGKWKKIRYRICSL